ncbi:nucleotidyltransferase family protein [Propioniciclava tarda]|uniref:nucleotidyltransferase family protein n=1 Tax=Propioniciclava tarda TaxID=433330 RepID=UPI00116D280E|nr:nucleotidyltransferase family protein [Propioniciclava tarda]SMO31863.1 Uncharacterised nucleotidyltransferase [Propioniciclava tarda]
MTVPPDALRVALDRHLVARNDRAAASLVADLRAVGVRALLLKGAATRALLRLPERSSADIDVLVAPSGRRPAGALLRRLGYTRARGIHSENWTHPTRASVDLHRTLPRVGLSPRQACRVLFAHADELKLGDATVEVLDVPARLVHLAIHATQDATQRPKDDLAPAIEVVDTTQWRAAASVARELEVAPTVAWALTQAGASELAALFGRPKLAPNDIAERGLRGYLTSSAHWSERGRRQLRLGENWARWQAGRVRRLMDGSSAWYRRRGGAR